MFILFQFTRLGRCRIFELILTLNFWKARCALLGLRIVYSMTYICNSAAACTLVEPLLNNVLFASSTCLCVVTGIIRFLFFIVSDFVKITAFHNTQHLIG
jgi:hypothetical protein